MSVGAAVRRPSGQPDHVLNVGFLRLHVSATFWQRRQRLSSNACRPRRPRRPLMLPHCPCCDSRPVPPSRARARASLCGVVFPWEAVRRKGGKYAQITHRLGRGKGESEARCAVRGSLAPATPLPNPPPRRPREPVTGNLIGVLGPEQIQPHQLPTAEPTALWMFTPSFSPT